MKEKTPPTVGCTPLSPLNDLIFAARQCPPTVAGCFEFRPKIDLTNRLGGKEAWHPTYFSHSGCLDPEKFLSIIKARYLNK